MVLKCIRYAQEVQANGWKWINCFFATNSARNAFEFEFEFACIFYQENGHFQKEVTIMCDALVIICYLLYHFLISMQSIN